MDGTTQARIIQEWETQKTELKTLKADNKRLRVALRNVHEIINSYAHIPAQKKACEIAIAALNNHYSF